MVDSYFLYISGILYLTSYFENWQLLVDKLEKVVLSPESAQYDKGVGLVGIFSMSLKPCTPRKIRRTAIMKRSNFPAVGVGLSSGSNPITFWDKLVLESCGFLVNITISLSY